MNSVAIVQARMASTRLPGKVLKPLGEKVVLEHVLERLSLCKLIDKIVVATTLDSGDDELVEWCTNYGVSCFRGDRDDVLSRFYFCALEYKADEIIRVTSDNPLIDPTIVDKTIELRRSKDCDYTANNIEKTFPHGLDAEVISFKALEEAHLEASEPFEREHVTQFVRHRPERYNMANLSASANWHDIRVTLDEEDDHQLIEIIMKLIGEGANYADLKRIFTKYPLLKKINDRARDWHAGYNKREHIV